MLPLLARAYDSALGHFIARLVRRPHTALPRPDHVPRAMHGRFSGSAMFWSTELVVAGMAQWLAEIRGLIDWLRGEGVATVGLMGYSIGSQVAGLAATLWPDVDFVALLAPVGHHL